MVENAVPSNNFDPWLIGDIFRYICSGFLVLSGEQVNQCNAVADSAFWSISNVLANIPTCGNDSIMPYLPTWIKI